MSQWHSNTCGVLDAVAEARNFIRVVADDPGLPRFVRREANRLLPVAVAEPELVPSRLDALRTRVLPDLPLWPPECDYARCVSVATFWRFHVAPAVRDFFRHHTEYQRHLEADPDPAFVARAHLGDGVLVPAPHSWLVPVDRIDGLNGLQTMSLLQLEQRPPYLVMILPVERMLAAGVKVREPRGLDAVHRRFTRWVPGDVPDERIDEDIPLAALGGLRWRP